MDLDKTTMSSACDAVQPDFEIHRQEHKITTQNLKNLKNEQIKDSLVTLMRTVRERLREAHTARRIPHYVTGAQRRRKHENHGPQRLRRRHAAGD